MFFNRSSHLRNFVNLRVPPSCSPLPLPLPSAGLAFLGAYTALALAQGAASPTSPAGLGAAGVLALSLFLVGGQWAVDGGRWV